MQPKKILVVTLEGGGNVPPVMGVARMLRQRGHQVAILTEPCLRPVVESSGLDFYPFRRSFLRTDRKEDIFRDTKSSPLHNPAFDHVVFGPAALTAEDTRFAIEQLKPDLILADVLLPAALIAGEAAGIPCVSLWHMPEYLPGPLRPPGGMGLTPGAGPLVRVRDWFLQKVFHLVMDKYLREINQVRKQYGLGRLNHVADLYHRADLRLMLTSRHFDFGETVTAPNLRYAGPVLDDPDWVSSDAPPEPSSHRPLVIVSFSSTFQQQQSLIQRCIGALGTMEVTGWVTLGPAMAQHHFDTPPNVQVMTQLQHSVWFPRASLVITHGGHGTLMRALTCGVPLVCLPMGRDQLDNAAKLARHGAGIHLSSGSGPETIRKAVSRVLKDPGFKQRAEWLGGLIRDETEDRVLVREIEGLLK